MRLLFTLSLILLFSQTLKAQQEKTFRSDTLNFSLQARYLFVSFGAGVEFPFRQHSFGIQLGYNAIPAEGNIHLGFNLDKIGALEYKRYTPTKSGTTKQFYYGSYLLFKDSKYASPHDADWEGDWYKGRSVNVGPLAGYKWYIGQRMYFELFLGLHLGWQWGELRWDNRDTISGQRNPTYQQAEKINYGLRIGLSFGFHPIRKD